MKSKLQMNLVVAAACLAAGISTSLLSNEEARAYYATQVSGDDTYNVDCNDGDTYGRAELIYSYGNISTIRVWKDTGDDPWDWVRGRVSTYNLWSYHQYPPFKERYDNYADGQSEAIQWGTYDTILTLYCEAYDAE